MSINTKEYFNITPEELATKASSLDCRFWESVREEQQVAREAFPDRASGIVGNDLFNTLFHFRPMTREDAPEPRRAQLINKLMESADWMKLHQATMGDDMLAAAGAIKLRERIGGDYTAEETMRKIEELERLNEKIEALGELQQDHPDNSDIQKQITDTMEAKEATDQELEKALGNHRVMGAIRRSVKEAADDIESAVQMAGGWGSEQGILQDFLFNPEVAGYLNDHKLRRILDIAGKMRETISAERAKRPKPGPQKVKLAMGSDLSRLVPTELAMLGDPDLEDIFLRRYTEGSLMLYEREEKPKQGKGPFIVCVDESGSMRGTREEWAKGLAFALCQQATREHRNFGAIAFGSQGQTRPILMPEPREFMEWINQCFMSGGTDFETPLDKAMLMISGDLPEADIIFITDGEAQCSDRFLRVLQVDKEAAKAKIIGIQIGPSGLDGLRAFSDVVFRLDATQGPRGLEAVMEEIK